MLELAGLVIRQSSFELRADLTFQAPVTAVLGPSGAGKSSLLNAIAGFLAPHGGRVLWQGRNVTGLAPAARPVAMLFQDNNLFPHLSIGDNLALTRTRANRQQKKQIAEALDRVELGGFEHRKPAQLSGGQQSRAALARVLLQDRPVLLLDEPFAALGPALRKDMLDLVAQVTRDKGLTAVMVSHDPKDALRICQEACVVADGIAMPPRETAALLRQPPEALARYLGA